MRVDQLIICPYKIELQYMKDSTLKGKVDKLLIAERAASSDLKAESYHGDKVS